MAITAFTQHYVCLKIRKLSINSTLKIKTKTPPEQCIPLICWIICFMGTFKLTMPKMVLLALLLIYQVWGFYSNRGRRKFNSGQLIIMRELFLTWSTPLPEVIIKSHLESDWNLPDPSCATAFQRPLREHHKILPFAGEGETQRVCPRVETEWKSGLFLLLF